MHKNYKKHWTLPDNFPSDYVMDAYLKPVVNSKNLTNLIMDLILIIRWKKTIRNSHGAPQTFQGLRQFCEKNFSWNELKCNEYLEPLQKLLKENRTQPKITDYFQKAENVAYIVSKRIQKAVQSLTTNYDLTKVEKPIDPPMTRTINEIQENKTKRPRPLGGFTTKQDPFDQFKYMKKRFKDS